MPEIQTYLPDAQEQAGGRLISYLNGLTHRLMNVYPQAEVESWTIQKAEAEAFLAAGPGATVALAPFITRVCFYHFGASDGPSTLQQVRDKCEAVHANALAWAEVAAFVNGTRARKQEELAAAVTIEEVHQVVHQAMGEIEAFRAAAGL